MGMWIVSPRSMTCSARPSDGSFAMLVTSTWRLINPPHELITCTNTIFGESAESSIQNKVLEQHKHLGTFTRKVHRCQEHGTGSIGNKANAVSTSLNAENHCKKR